MSNDELLASLSDEQKLPVAHPLGGPALVIAGAGSGKTRVMTARVKWLITEGVPERQIAGITFTNKAADELRHRCGFGDDPKVGPRISTIHSLSLSAIRKDPRGFGLLDRVTPLDSGDQREMLSRLLELRKKDPKFAEMNIWQWLEKVGYHRARGLGFAVEYNEDVHKAALKAHKGYHALTEQDLVLWRDYELTKTQSSVVDFDDMLHLVVRRGRQDDAWRARLQKMFKTVLVDESQDTNPVQWAFIELLLADDCLDLFAVGDLSQSIYAFNGAAPEILGGMVHQWRGVVPQLYKLEDNYRSVPKVVGLSNAIQKTMTGTVPLQMNSKREPRPLTRAKTIGLIQGLPAKDIADGIAEAIANENVLKTGEFRFKDNAILVRSATQIGDLEDALVRRRVPYVVRGGQGLFQTEEARDTLSYMKLLVNPNDVMAFKRAVAVLKRGIGDVTVEKLAVQAQAKFDGDLLKAAADSDHMKMRPVGELFQELAQVKDICGLYLQILKITSYQGFIRDKYGKNVERRDAKLRNLERLNEALIALTDADPNATLSDIIFRVTLDSKAEAEKEDGVVTISTIHSAKGLEWPRVFVTNIFEGSLPHQWSSSEKEIEEERRLFYVAVTRARDALTLCVPNMVSRGPNVARVQPSRFLVELKVI